MLIDFEAIRRLFRQQNLVGVLPFAFMLLGKNFFEPMGLMLSDCLIHIFRIVKDDKFLTAIVTAKSTRLCKAGRTLPRLTLLYRYCSHRLLHFIETLIEAVVDRLNEHIGDIAPTTSTPDGIITALVIGSSADAGSS